MNDSGLAVRKVLAREHAPLGDLLIVADDFALPFGKLRFRESGSAGGHNGLRSIIDELGTEKFSRFRVGIGDPVRNAPRPRAVPVRARRGTAARRAARRGRRRGRGVGARGPSKAANRFNTFQLREADLTGSPHPARSTAARRRTASAGRGPAGGASSRGVAATVPDHRGPPLRGRRGRDRRIAERIAATSRSAMRRRATRTRPTSTSPRPTPRSTPSTSRRRRSTRRPRRPRPGRRIDGTTVGRPSPTRPVGPAAAPAGDRLVRDAPGAARRAAATSAGLGATPGVTPCRTAPRRTSPRRWRSTSGSCGSPATPRSATGSRRSWRPGSAIRRPSPCSSRGPPWPTSAASSWPMRPPPVSPPWRRGGSGRARVLVASVQALLQHTIAPDDLPAEPRELRVGARLPQDALLRDLFDLGYTPVPEVAGRGEFARRGGIVDVFPPSMDLPIRIEFFGDEIDSLRAFDPTDQRTTGQVERAVLLPASEFLLPVGRRGDPRAARRGAACRSGSPPTSPASRARPRPAPARPTPAGRVAASGRGRRRGLGRPSWPRRPRSTTSTRHAARPRRARRYRRGGRVPVAAGRRAARRAGRGRRAAEGLAVDLSRAARLEGPPRRVTDARADLGVEPPADVAMAGGAGLGRPVRLARAGPAARRAGRLGEAIDGWRDEEGAPDRPRLRPGARLAEILDEAGHPVAVVDRLDEPPRPARSPSSVAASTAGSSGAPTA